MGVCDEDYVTQKKTDNRPFWEKEGFKTYEAYMESLADIPF
jgi:hypothetical protein